MRITVVTAGGKALAKPFPGGGQANEFVPRRPPHLHGHRRQRGLLGLLYEFGKFRMLDLADLLSAVEYDLMCPTNRVGTVDLFMVSHHGLKVSNAKFLVHALRPKAAIMNNGRRKGGDPETAGHPEEFSGLAGPLAVALLAQGGQPEERPDGLHRQPARPVRGEADQGGRPARRRVHRHQSAEQFLQDVPARRQGEKPTQRACGGLWRGRQVTAPVAAQRTQRRLVRRLAGRLVGLPFPRPGTQDLHAATILRFRLHGRRPAADYAPAVRAERLAAGVGAVALLPGPRPIGP